MRDILYSLSRWILFVVILSLAFYLFYAQIYLVYGPKVADVDARLPTTFHSSPRAYWSWLLGSALLAGGVGYWTWRVYRRGPTPDTAEPTEDELGFAATIAAIANLRRGHERDPVYLIIAEGDASVTLLAAAGLGPDAAAPDDVTPVRGFRTADGLFIQCAGPIAQGGQLANQVLAALPGAPTLRGIVVLVPVATLLGAKSHGSGHLARSVLRDLAGTVATRCPVYVVVSGMEDVAGFLEFARRSPVEYRTSARFGFSIPATDDPAQDLVAREYDRLVGWYNLSILDMMEAGPLQQEGNEALFALARWFRRVREPMLHFLEAARPSGDDPFEILNAYFAATGAEPEDRAFIEGLMRMKVAGDPRSVRWSLRALAADGTLRRLAIGLGAGAGTVALVVWGTIFAYLQPMGWLDPLLLVAIAAGWGAGWYELLRGFRRAARS